MHTTPPTHTYTDETNQHAYQKITTCRRKKPKHADNKTTHMHMKTKPTYQQKKKTYLHTKEHQTCIPITPNIHMKKQPTCRRKKNATYIRKKHHMHTKNKYTYMLKKI